MRLPVTVLLLATLESIALAEAPPALRGESQFEAASTGAPAHHGGISKILYVNRCEPNCTFTAHDGPNSANSSITNFTNVGEADPGTTYVVSSFQHGDALWNTLMECIRDVYRPFDVEVTDVDPGDVPHHEAVAAGTPFELAICEVGQPCGVGGRAPSQCDPMDNQVSFSFLNFYAASQVYEMCATVAQESAHSYGIPDHLFDCTDAMTYLALQGQCGRKFFRNKMMPCGEFQEGTPQCRCGTSRVNSHEQLLAVFGAGQDPFPPTVSIASPGDGGTLGSIVAVEFDDARGVYRAELWINGWRWGVWIQDESLTAPPPTSYLFELPDDFPNGVADIEVIVYNDLGGTATASITATRGSPCGGPGDCAAGQQCEDGRCFWDEPTQELGEACEFDQQCIGPDTWDGTCVSDTEGVSICTRDCYRGVNDNCPEGFECLAESEGDAGVCWFESVDDGGGCCSTGGGDGRAALGSLAFGLIAGAVVMRRRRRR